MSDVIKKYPIVFFDGFCGLCNFSVDFLLKVDRKRVLRYSPLQGHTAKNLLSGDYVNDLSTIVFYQEGEVSTRSRAVFAILSQLGWPYKVLSVFRILPTGLSDAVYRLISKNRYTWFGKREICRIPTPEERALFLD